MDPSFDETYKDKLSEDQHSTLKEFKGIIYDNEKYKPYRDYISIFKNKYSWLN